MKRIFILLGMLFVINTVFSQNIIKAEYFLDTDPGQGNGAVVPGFTAGDIVNFPLTVPTSALSSGFHSLNIRVADANGVWSRYETRGFYLSTSTTTNTTNITAAEYFIDSDPGLGDGMPANIGSPGPIVSFVVPVPVSLNSGFHFLAIRVKDQEGKWSMFEQRGFYISSSPVNASPIVAAEYFYDIDPGTGSASPLSVTTPGDIITQTFLVPVPGSLSEGVHVLAIRVKDQEGHWSMFERDTITVGAVSGSITCPGNVTVDPFTNNCKAVVSNIDAVGLPEDDSSYTYTMTGATTGNGTGTASGQLFNAGVTTVTYALISSPTVSCSFTVTVNTSVTPTAVISTPNTTICEGTPTYFLCTSTDAGFFTNSWQWKKNGVNVGTNSNIYWDSTLQNSDAITVAMTSAISCAVPQTVTSAPVVMTVHETITPSISITASATTICPGQLVTFTAMPTNGGSQPIYEWVKNGSFVGAGTTIYQTSDLANGDSVYIRMHNTTDCVTDAPVKSNVIYITTAQLVTPSVSISQSPTTICSGTIATFTASPVNGGSTPTYQWKVNDINVGNNSNTYQIPTPVNGNVVKVVMTSSLGCANPSSATSNSITVVVNDSIPEFVSITASATTICAGTLVTFVAQESGSGSSTFQWKLNGNNVGTNSLVYRSDSLRNGDKVKVVISQSYACSPPTVTSNEITITVNSSGTPSVNVLASTSNICSGQQVTFTATPVNGGATPSYQWKLNGNNIPAATNSTYQSSSLSNGDVITVLMTSSLVCASPTTASSAGITMIVGSSIAPSVSISASAIDICAGQQVTFTATPTNGGDSPTYQWKLNGNNVGLNSATYQTASLANADTIKVVMTSSLSCTSSPTAISNSISMDVSTSVLPSVSITADLTYICQGELVIFTATPTNGGNPTYQWKLNGNNVGTNSNIYQSTSFANNDSVEVVMTSSLGCASSQAVTSNNIFMTVTTAVTPHVSITASATSVCAGTLVTFTATPTNGGTPSYQWKLNGNDVGIDYYKYENSSLSAGDVISVTMTTTLSCVTTSTAVSNSITITAASSLITYYRDLDADGYGNSSSGTIQACGATNGYVSNNTDCNDNHAAVHPGATEVCGNNLDDDCDGQTDEGCNATSLPVLILRTYPVKEGDAGQTILNVEINLDIPAPFPVSVQYSTVNDDAVAGFDYIATNGVLVIPAGMVSGSIQVRIIGDLLRESNERFKINFTNPVNAELNGEPYSRIMIIDNDKGKNNDNAAAPTDQVPVKEEVFKIPTITRRNQVWVIPQIGNYENEVLIVNVQGQVVNKFVNYKNQAPIGNVSTGLYFYRIRIMERPGQYKYYSGRVMITE